MPNSAFSSSIHSVSRDGLVYHAAFNIRFSAAFAAGPIFSLEFPSLFAGRFFDILRIGIGTAFEPTTAVASGQAYWIQTAVNTGMGGGGVIPPGPQNRSASPTDLNPVSMGSCRTSTGGSALTGLGGSGVIVGVSAPQPRNNAASSYSVFSGKDLPQGYLVGIMPSPTVTVAIVMESASVIGDVVSVSMSWCEGLANR